MEVNWRPYCGLSLVAWIAFIVGCSRGGIPLRDGLGHDVPLNARSLAERIDADGLQRHVQAERGNVVLVDFWATYCQPCLKAFPHTLELGRTYADRGLTVMTVSLDGPRQLPHVNRFLGQQRADCPCFISALGSGSKAFSEFGIESGAIPYFKLFDRTGAERYTFTGASVEIEQRVQELLDESPGQE